MSQAIDDLRHEHEAISQAAAVLDGMSQRLSAEEPVELSDLQGMVAFLKEFADGCHHGKEDGLLFPALVAADAALQQGLVGALGQDHARGRALVAAMDDALQPEDVQTGAFVEAAQACAELLRGQVHTENQMLFPLAERLLAPARLRTLAGEFQAHEEQVIGAGRHAQLHRMLVAWQARYLA